MPKFVIDEDMPRFTGTILKEHGYEVLVKVTLCLCGEYSSILTFGFVSIN